MSRLRQPKPVIPLVPLAMLREAQKDGAEDSTVGTAMSVGGSVAPTVTDDAGLTGDSRDVAVKRAATTLHGLFKDSAALVRASGEVVLADRLDKMALDFTPEAQDAIRKGTRTWDPDRVGLSGKEIAQAAEILRNMGAETLALRLSSLGEAYKPNESRVAASRDQHGDGHAEVVRTMVRQIDARDPWTRARIGAHDMHHSADGANTVLNIPCNPSGIYVKVTYNAGTDLYSVEGFRVPRGSGERVLGLALSEVGAENLGGAVETAYDAALAVKYRGKLADDRRTGWLKGLTTGDPVMIGELPPLGERGPTTFRVSTVDRISSLGQMTLADGTVFSPDGIEKGPKKWAGLIPLETMPLSPKTLTEVEARLMAAEVPAETDKEGCFQVGVVLLPQVVMHTDQAENLDLKGVQWRYSVGKEQSPIRVYSQHAPILRRQDEWSGPKLFARLQGVPEDAPDQRVELVAELSFLPAGCNVALAPKKTKA